MFANREESRILINMSLRVTCASMIISMHIECALDPSTVNIQRQWNQRSIQGGLAYLRASLPQWESIKWSLRMFDAILAKLNLGLEASNSNEESLSSRQRLSYGTAGATKKNVSRIAPNSNEEGISASKTRAVDFMPAFQSSYSSNLDQEPDFISESFFLDPFLDGLLDDTTMEDLFGAEAI